MKSPYDIIRKPVLTEKSYDNLPSKTDTFVVARDANKLEIKSAVEEAFGVKVADVNTMIVRGKERRMRMQLGRRPNWKKAIVKLQPGMKISEFEGA